MMHKPPKVPCGSCPYRKDVPAGIIIGLNSLRKIAHENGAEAIDDILIDAQEKIEQAEADNHMK